MALLRLHPSEHATIARRSTRRIERVAASHPADIEAEIDCGCWYFLARILIWATRNGGRG